MTHELKQMFEAFLKARENKLKAVIASVVHLDGSSYRKPGVRMLLLEDGNMIGAVSGGCVEKDIQRQAELVFNEGQPRMMMYDGRYRLGCEGILYILLEPFKPSEECIARFQLGLKNREEFQIHSYYQTQEGPSDKLGSILSFGNDSFELSERETNETRSGLLTFDQVFPPCFKMMIFGAEHDAVVLCRYAALNGWEVSVISGPLESKTIENFPGASSFHSVSPDQLELDRIDGSTAIVIMSHNFANDLKYLLEIKDSSPAYIGLLGPVHRREKLMTQLLEYSPDINETFLERLHGPAGLNIGSETPQEIAISILSEILAVTRNQVPLSLKEKEGGIHA
ncbi:MAG: XdhC family protein [Flavobacteriaceae bacterium]|nr:XdhC family protein [Flavobacteriaceae bacterium]